MSMPQPLHIRGMGCYLPPDVVTNDELEQRMGLASGWIEQKTGVVERRWAKSDITASAMAARAAQEALDNAGISMDQVSLIVNASGTCQRAIPDNAPLFQREMGFGRSGIPCFSVHSTCLSFVSAIEVAAALLATGSYQNILVLTAEIPSRGLDFDSPESAVLFGDAATAAVLSLPDPEGSGMLHAYRMETYGDGADLTTINAGTERYPYTAQSTPKDALFRMDGKRVYKMAHKYLAGFMERMIPNFSEQANLIKAVIPHQSTLLGIKSLRYHGLDMERTVITIREYGNCVAASIPLTLYQAIGDGTLQRGERFLMIGTGAGLSIASALLTY